MTLQENPTLPARRRLAALAIAGVTGLVLVALSHHPVADHAASAQESLAQMAALQHMDGLVHGILIVLLAVLAGGFAVFGQMLGAHRPPLVFARLAYGLGCCAMVGAMLIDGFITPQLARQFVAAPATDVEVVRIVLRCLGIAIQVLTKAGLLSMCAALLAWSYALCSGAPISLWSSWCAVLGFVAGALPAIYLLFTDVQLAPASLMGIFAFHAAWNLAAAGLLYGQRRGS